MSKSIAMRVFFASIASLIFMAFVFQCHPDQSESRSFEEPEREFNRELPDDGIVQKAVLSRVVDGPVVKLNDIKEGICHQVLPEKGHIRPGMLIVGGDSHTTTYGAFNAAGCGIGNTDFNYTMSTLLTNRKANIRLTF